jgi:hypothetical protein
LLKIKPPFSPQYKTRPTIATTKPNPIKPQSRSDRKNEQPN